MGGRLGVSIHGASPRKIEGERERKEVRKAMSLAIKKAMNTMGNEYGGTEIVEGKPKFENRKSRIKS